MKAAVVYSTLTGNTRKVAEAFRAGLGEGAELFDVNDAPDPSGYDLVAVGFWVDRGHPDQKSMDYMKRIWLFCKIGHGASCRLTVDAA